MPPSKWNSVDVGAWICSIGMGQYKKSFLHNQVDGPLLLALDISLLKHELKVSSLGHRVTIYDAISQLLASDKLAERSLSPAARQGLAKGALPMNPASPFGLQRMGDQPFHHTFLVGLDILTDSSCPSVQLLHSRNCLDRAALPPLFHVTHHSLDMAYCQISFWDRQQGNRLCTQHLENLFLCLLTQMLSRKLIWIGVAYLAYLL